MFAKSLIAWLLVLMLVAPAAGATDYVNIEQRLSAEQRRQTGIDSLTSEQLAALNSILRDEARNATDRDAEGGLLAQGRSLAGFDGDPIKNLELVADPDKNFKVIMKDGKIYKNQL